MDFFDRQDASRRATRHLVLMFALAFVAVGLATGILILLVIGVSGEGQPAAFVISEPDVLASIATIVVAVMVLASLFRVASLAQGGGHVARMLGGKQSEQSRAHAAELLDSARTRHTDRSHRSDSSSAELESRGRQE